MLNMFILKGQRQNLASGQGHVTSGIGQNRSYCISVDASLRNKEIDIIPTALSLFYQKLEAKTILTSYDLE